MVLNFEFMDVLKDEINHSPKMDHGDYQAAKTVKSHGSKMTYADFQVVNTVKVARQRIVEKENLDGWKSTYLTSRGKYDGLINYLHGQYTKYNSPAVFSRTAI